MKGPLVTVIIPSIKNENISCSQPIPETNVSAIQFLIQESKFLQEQGCQLRTSKIPADLGWSFRRLGFEEKLNLIGI